ncbi:hypothetical protein TVAG_580310 [Trichomonas vaginalis G3]|uniref:Uncharacterized protein n=1 Tax=Trichomonas vaginalis (strain ATCC PRA-98 / G3) TaxID=412133 RepID=A2G859_TRIV3|nr:myotrophin family [Trichomonas vaginalis G3]EAX86661.1 hypothetical protein TVAG_580310 [Trichomonas vaginalis G3]KAI5497815.1 myotrophin family [Trichomonas vaginalis G3]|eukprot:XP_001299591.1 hypothetical protein [Trichomonas vaginalis G3]
MELEPIQELDEENYEEDMDEMSMMSTLQRYLTNISESTYDELDLYFHSIPLSQNPDFYQLVIDEIISAYSVRPWNLKLLAKLCYSMKDHEGFKENLLATVFKAELDFRRVENMITRVCLLRECFNLRLTDVKTLVTCLSNFKRNYSNLPEELFILFIYFAPEIEKHYNEIYKNLMEYFRILHANCRVPQAYQMFKNFEQLKENDWQGLHDCIEFAGTSESIQYAIRHDDLEKFKKVCPNVNTRIPKSAFEQCAISQFVMVPLQYATLFNATKIVDYILTQNPDILNTGPISSGDFYDGRVEAVYDGKESPEYEQSIALAFAYISNPKLAIRYEQMNFGMAAVTKYTAAFRANFSVNYEETDNYECLFAAVRNNNLEAVVSYHNSGCAMDVRSDNNMLPEHIAASLGHSFILQVLMSFSDQSIFNVDDEEEEEAEPGKGPTSEGDYFGRLPIHLACIAGHFDVVQVLAKMNVDINSADNMGKTCLLLAAASGHTAIVDFLLKQGAEPNAKDREGFTPLLAAAQNGRTDCVSLLVNWPNVDCTATAEFGTNALHIAVQGNYLDAAEELLKSKKFPPNGKDMIGRTPADFATSKEMLDLLDRYSQ